MKKNIITFIGGGNMATSLIGGLIQTGISPDNLRVADSVEQPLAAQYPIRCFTNNIEAIQGSQVIVLAVKPQILPEVAKSLNTALSSPYPLIVSIAAGIQVKDLNRWLGGEDGRKLSIVRVMPNTPALVQSGAAALFAGPHVNKTQHELAENILRAVGLTVWLDDETQMDIVTALSGSGPAYFFLIMEMLEKAAINLGLNQETARLLTLQTAFGAAKMALESQEDAATLREQVTSKGGTTEQALQVLQKGGLQHLFDEALKAAQQRSIQLAEQLGDQ